MSALLADAAKGGLPAFWRDVSAPEAVAALKLTLLVSALIVLSAMTALGRAGSRHVG